MWTKMPEMLAWMSQKRGFLFSGKSFWRFEGVWHFANVLSDVPKTGKRVSREKAFGVLRGCNILQTFCRMSLFRPFLFWKNIVGDLAAFFQLSSSPPSESLSLSLESNSSHDSWYVSSDSFCQRAMLCAVANAISLQRENIIADRPFLPDENELITAILRFIWIVNSSVRMSSDATDAGNGSMHSRSGSISARQVGHVFFVFKDFSKHDMQNLCPHAVIATFVGPGTSMHTGHTSTSDSDSDSGSGAAAATDWPSRYCMWGVEGGSFVQTLFQFLHELG